MIGRKLRNRYEVIEHVGDGSTATVYRGRDTRLGRAVALKVLLPHVRDTVRKRFLQEANSVAQLNHPNIMAIYDIDEEDDQPFLVVEYVEGQPLTHFIPASFDTLVDLGYQIAMALQYAHDRHIIHRDIKPANIKVTPEGQVKIMDLGLALPREAKRVTADGMIIGTPAYLSPEQAQGHALDHRTDIYSLGIVLYELATGQLPFDADEISALLIQQVRQPAPPPRLIVPDLPPSMEMVILKALEKNPTRRFQSCRTMADALRDSLRATSTPDAPTMARRPVALNEATSAPPARVIMADDHQVLRTSLGRFLESHGGFTIVAEAADGDSALRQTLNLLPDILLLDLNMPGKGGLDVLPAIRQHAPNVKVLVLTGRDEDWYIVRALRAGAHGYVLKSISEQELVESIRKVLAGNLVLGAGVAEKIVTGLLTDPQAHPQLSEAERRVLLLVAAGLDNEAIARRLKLGMALVIETLASAMNKLNAKDRNAAALEALKQGYILLDDLHQL